MKDAAVDVRGRDAADPLTPVELAHLHVAVVALRSIADALDAANTAGDVAKAMTQSEKEFDTVPEIEFDAVS